MKFQSFLRRTFLPKVKKKPGKRLTKYQREKRQLKYLHEKDDNDNDYTDFRVVDPAKSGDELFDTEGKY